MFTFSSFGILVELPCSYEIHKKQKKVHASFLCLNNISKIAETSCTHPYWLQWLLQSLTLLDKFLLLFLFQNNEQWKWMYIDQVIKYKTMPNRFKNNQLSCKLNIKITLTKLKQKDYKKKQSLPGLEHVAPDNCYLQLIMVEYIKNEK